MELRDGQPSAYGPVLDRRDAQLRPGGSDGASRTVVRCETPVMTVHAVPRLHLGSYAVCRDSQRRILLARMAVGADIGRWTLPGGHVESNEHPDDTVVREIAEETGLTDVRLGAVLGINSRTYDQPDSHPWAPLHHVGIVYLADDVRGTICDERDGSTDQCRWFMPDELTAVDLVPLATFGIGHVRD